MTTAPSDAPSVNNMHPPSDTESNAAPHLHGVQLSSGVGCNRKSGIITFLDLSQLHLIPGFNPRATPGDLTQLAASILAEGLIIPLLVRPAQKIGQFEIIAGERRYRALKSLAWTQPVSCLVRPDLVGDDERALAVAMAENCDESRTPLNMIEFGIAAKKLEKRGWTNKRISMATGIHAQRVQNALSLLRLPEDVKAKVADKSICLAVGLECAKLDAGSLGVIKAKLGPKTTARDVRQLRKDYERALQEAKATPGTVSHKPTARGTVPKRSGATLWRAAGEKTAMLQELCKTLESAEPDEIGTPDYHEIRGWIAGLLWDRGDRTTGYAPDMEPKKESKDYAAQVKDLMIFDTIVKAEAAKYIEPEVHDE